MKGELPIPSMASEDSASLELARIWTAFGDQHVSIATEVWEDPAAWGIMLADMARHIANAYVESEGMDYDAALRRVKEGFDAEWYSPTDEPRSSP